MTARSLSFAIAVAASLVLAAPHAGAAHECVNAVDRGQALRDKLMLRAARREFIKCASESCAAIVRPDCVKWLADVDQRLPTVVIRAVDATGRDLDAVTVTVDGILEVERLGGSRIPLDPGLRTLRFEHAGDTAVEMQIVAREGEHNRIIDVTFGRAAAAAPVSPGPAPAPAPSPARSSFPVAGVVFSGVALLGLGAFAFFGATGKSEVDDLRSTCAPRCASGDVDAARTKVVIANVALGAAIVSLGVAGYFFFLAPTPDGQGGAVTAAGRL